MIDYIPSKSIKEYLKEKGHVFSDFEKATLIWNCECSRGETLASLRELAAQTSDEKTRIQIWERIKYEEKMLEIFMDNRGGKYIYEVVDSEDSTHGHFSTCDAAIARAKRSIAEDMACYFVDKWLLVSGDEMPDETETDSREYKIGECKEGQLCFDEDGKLYSMWSVETGTGDDIMVCNSDRFEHRLVEIPNPFKNGDIVRCLLNDAYCIIRIDEEILLEHVKDNWLTDYIDKILVTYIMEDGIWYSNAINPIYLESAIPEPERDGEDLCRALEAMSVFMKGDESPEQVEEVILASRDYAGGYCEQSVFDTAQSVDDIMR